MDDQNKNLILATALSFLVIMVWFFIFPPEEPVQQVANEATTSQPAADGTVLPPSAGLEGSTIEATTPQELRETALAAGDRITIETPRVEGSISLTGGRIDDLSLKDYRETLNEESDIVTLFSPVGSAHGYYALYGWVPGGNLTFDQVPSANTAWNLESGSELTVGSPVTLKWDNGAGLIFRRTIAIDENYMFDVTQTVENTTNAPIRAYPYSMLVRHGEPTDLKNFFILHEGIIRQSGEELTEIDYDHVQDFDIDTAERGHVEKEASAGNGWIGFTDHYWMSVLIPDAKQSFESVTKYVPGSDRYHTEMRLPVMEIAAGTTGKAHTQLYAGAKEWDTIRTYQRDGGVYKFLDSIDWGWFFFLTKPIFAVLHWLNTIIGNMGWSIIVLTLLIKALLLPLAYKSYVSMAKMKELQPEMEKLKESAGDDRQKMQQGMMKLYKDNKVNPAAGCLPILMQIPIFFSLYKVIFVTLELRHAPWVGWIKDLSAPDSSSLLNLWGILPFAGPEPGSIMALIFIGILPLILGVSMWLQQKLNPAPTDPTQAMIFAWMPWVFMFMLGSFASGLVLYWIANNVITFVQQYAIMRSQGYKPDLFGNIKSSFKRKPKVEE
ncbi:membrane protein insertase YidC [uncultured Litoreibacter sp.]|uniref:membrane protein insertase YidC n=1 Tax=uncultured Litoreibacter sp. TaxID=1392394 RepID=UPI00261BE14F|nr:membrane protein insertase YidC [uncultured Litoreibacter sp.]